MADVGARVSNGATITLASYNMRKAIGLDRRRDPKRVLEVLREIDADIIALQEADKRFGGRGAELGLSLYTPIIVKYRDEKTDLSVRLEDYLR